MGLIGKALKAIGALASRVNRRRLRVTPPRARLMSNLSGPQIAATRQHPPMRLKRRVSKYTPEVTPATEPSPALLAWRQSLRGRYERRAKEANRSGRYDLGAQFLNRAAALA